MKYGFAFLTAHLFCVLHLRPLFSDSAVPQAEIIGELPGPSNIYFVPYLVVDSQDIVLSTWIHCPFLKPVKLRWRPIADALAWLLLAAGVVEANPGPGLGLRQVRKFKFPCGVCSVPVTSNQCGVQCECGYSWLHARCIGMHTPTYKRLQTPGVVKSVLMKLYHASLSRIQTPSLIVQAAAHQAHHAFPVFVIPLIHNCLHHHT